MNETTDGETHEVIPILRELEKVGKSPADLTYELTWSCRYCTYCATHRFGYGISTNEICTKSLGEGAIHNLQPWVGIDELLNQLNWAMAQEENL